MAIVANFTADVVSGAAPLAVTFTDTSTGTPNRWLWDFGDGHFSDSQNPSHTYACSGTVTVKLTAWIFSTGPSVSMGTFGPSLSSRFGSAFNDNAAAFADLLSTPFTFNPGSDVQYWLNHQASNFFTYFQKKSFQSIFLPSSPSGVGPSTAILEARLTAQNNDFGSVSSDIGGLINATDTKATWLPFLDVTGLLGTTPEVTFNTNNLVLIPDPGPGANNGIVVAFRTIEYTTSSDDNHDIETKIDFISVSGMTAAFSATPRKALTSTTIQFTDESTESPTSWSWKRRPSGINATYVEFSTNENPSEAFDITDPTP